jgi:hypothetical protein
LPDIQWIDVGNDGAKPGVVEETGSHTHHNIGEFQVVRKPTTRRYLAITRGPTRIRRDNVAG